MAGYGPTEMVRTPWGNAGELRSKKLNPGRGTPREEVVRNQRERLFAAMVATVAEKGYEGTSVADLIKLSGVSRRTFYEHFQDKEDCFCATVEELMEAGVGFAAHGFEKSEGTWEEQARRMLEAFLGLVAAQPAAARLCLVDSYAAGETTLSRLAAAVDEIERRTLAALDSLPGHAGTPPELARAIIGGLYRVLYRHLYRGTEPDLVPRVGELWRWAMSFPPPPRPLRARTRRSSRNEPPAGSFAAHIPSERILRGFAAAVAEKGYADVAIADIAAHARISQATFYAHFKDKEDALLAALDSSGAQLVAATLPAVRRSNGGPEAVRTAVIAAFGFLAAEPAFARLRSVEVFAAGPEAVEQCDKIEDEVSEAILAMRPEDAPQLSPLSMEATLGAINSLLFEQVRNVGPHSLPSAAPLATYIALAPFVGAEKACAVANGEPTAR
jgi:AcrR family transcriptional regulator